MAPRITGDLIQRANDETDHAFGPRLGWYRIRLAAVLLPVRTYSTITLRAMSQVLGSGCNLPFLLM